MRGLESSRQAARQGFALAITTLLQQLPAIGTSQGLEALEDALKVPSSAKVCIIHILSVPACRHLRYERRGPRTAWQVEQVTIACVHVILHMS